MREPYIPLTFNEEDLMRNFHYKKEGCKELWAYKEVDELILKTYEILTYIRDSYEWKARDKSEGNEYADAVYMINLREAIDENSEQKYKDKLEGFFEVNERLKTYRDSIFSQIGNPTLIMYMTQKTIPDCAMELGISIEEFIVQYLQGKHQAEKIAYWNYTEKCEEINREMYRICKDAGHAEGKTIEEFYAHLRKEKY